jgi:hypothetical protein
MTASKDATETPVIILNWCEAATKPRAKKYPLDWRECGHPGCTPRYCEGCDGLGWTQTDRELYGD